MMTFRPEQVNPLSFCQHFKSYFCNDGLRYFAENFGPIAEKLPSTILLLFITYFFMIVFCPKEIEGNLHRCL